MRELKTLIPYFKKYTRVYLVGLAAVIGSNLINTLAPRLLQQGIDAIGRPEPLPAIRRAAILLIVASVAGGVLRYVMRQLLNSVSRRVEYDLRNTLFDKLLRLPQSYYDRTPTGDLMARATNDLLAVRMLAGPALMYLVDTVTRTLILIPAMMRTSSLLATLALLPLLALPFAEAYFGRRIHARSLAVQDHFGKLTDFVHQNLSGIRIVRAYNQETPETEAFARCSEEYVALNLKLARAQAALEPLLMLLGGVSSVIVLLVGGGLVLEGRITAGAFVAFFLYLALLVWPFVFLGWAINLAFRGTAAMSRINRVLEEPNPLPEPAAPGPLPAGRGARAIAFEDVWFRYPAAPDRDWVLAGVSFAVPAGSSLGIVGPTGAGKSAIVELLAREYDPDRGRITIDGVDLKALTLDQVRSALGMVPQETFLFSATIRDNVLLGQPDDGRLDRVADVSQLAEALPALPTGVDTMLGERGINLSGGQKQRAAIARALAKDPPIVVLDDALSAVDSHTEARILERLRSTLVGTTSVVVSHRAAAVRHAAEIIVLEAGRIVERGSYEQLLRDNGRFASLVRTQVLEEELETITTSGGGTPASASGASPPAG
jgi:ATP-binding cassette, subfamily B, multidrug efflux pump